MVYDVLVKLSQTDSLRDKTIVMKDNSIIAGGAVSEVTRSEIKYRGGESGQEVLTEPIDKVIEIRQNESVIYKRKKHIEKVYPRG